MTPTLKRRLVRESSDGAASSKALLQSLNLPVLLCTLRRTLNGSEKYKYKKKACFSFDSEA